MAKRVIYPLKNDYTIKLSEKKEEQVRGICVAASAMWCKTIAIGMPMEGSKPNALVAYEMQRQYRLDVKKSQDDEAAHRRVLAGLRLDFTTVCRRLPTRRFLELMRDNPGLYTGGEGSHCMAWCTAFGGRFHTFDIEQDGSLGGLFEYDSFGDWRDDIEEYYEEYDFWTSWGIRGSL